ncbi:TspO/MBR-related protein [Aspergillus ambiguus]|uniref:TspO/MBR family protein n=1 Tax=Aspergillus ambiguus TaxID=176160 RepID=UPI003CCDC427
MPWSAALPQTLFTSPVLSVAAPITAGSLVGYLVNRGRGTKETYKSLRKPPYYPPSWLFAPVWTVLYGMMGFAAHHATITGFSTTASLTLRELTASSQTLYVSQLALNYLWMPLFFGMGKPSWALADILMLGVNVGALLRTWWKTDCTAFWLMMPYAAWLGYATYLNAAIGVVNNWTLREDKRE